MRKTKFATGEYYHIYNRGVDKRAVFKDDFDLKRFFLAMSAFNTREPIGSIYEEYRPRIKNLEGQAKKQKGRLVNFICYCLNPNHFHFILQQVADGGIPKFMHKLATGHTMFFNGKYKRSGSLFQGTYKARYIVDNDYLLHLSAYVNLNFKIHKFGGLASKFVKSSWEEYISAGRGRKGFCKKEIILNQFRGRAEYKKFALSTLPEIIERKKQEKELEKLLID